jgi:uroporphyrinogen III methyltransferase/synthase
MMLVQKGTVYLVGAGPGDPGLITRAGLDVLGQADVVVYDRLASSSLLLEARPEARLVYVGKSPERHAMSQHEINRTLAEEASIGKSVCRLKGGDPFLFGRGGEEAEHLRQSGIPFVVIPGVTSAIAVPAYAGIPVTDRRAASSVAIVTGHEDAEKETSSVNWSRLARATDTVVVLMGMKNLGEIVRQLIAGGRPPGTAAAVIQWGTTGRQRVVRSDLSRIAQETAADGITHPAILVVGDVVALSDSIHWFEPGPLAGLRILVTRPRHQASVLAEMLQQRGAELVIASVIRVERITVEADRLRALLAERWDWVLFTSANGVTSFRDHLLNAGCDWRTIAGAKLGAIGPGTAAALRDSGLHVDFVPSSAIAESLAEELPDVTSATRVLLPRAQEARDALPEIVRRRGGSVEVLPVYRTVPDEQGLGLLRAALSDEDVDVVTFSSSSAVRSLVDAVGAESLSRCAVACIGPITAATARERGLHVDIEADQHTLPGLVAALEAYAATRARSDAVAQVPKPAAAPGRVEGSRS